MGKKWRRLPSIIGIILAIFFWRIRFPEDDSIGGIQLKNAVTYSLAPGQQNSEEYYRCVREFTDELLERASDSLMTSIREFTKYLNKYKLEELRRDEEYILELLSFGLLWKTYSGYSLTVRVAPYLTLSRMAEWRKRHQKFKPAIDLVRGVLVTLFLIPFRATQKTSPLPTLHDVDRLCLWLEATGEFREQALRFVRWRGYWEAMPASRWAEGCAAVFNFVDWFIARSEETIGQYTQNVEGFLAESRDRYRWREDRVQCSRSRPEYHLNMVGAEIMNRAFCQDFKNTDARALLLPGCMRARTEEECEAESAREGLRCKGCLPECHVNQLREMGRKHNFETYITPHASDLSLWSPRPDQPRRGVVAVACVTSLVEGGWGLKRYGVCAQCVLLDYSGCKKHWHRDGVSTSLNIRQLKRILEGRMANSVS